MLLYFLDFITFPMFDYIVGEQNDGILIWARMAYIQAWYPQWYQLIILVLFSWLKVVTDSFILP